MSQSSNSRAPRQGEKRLAGAAANGLGRPAPPQWHRFRARLALGSMLASTSAPAQAAPQQWEQLSFPFPIVGAPPQLEQQVQVFNHYFRGTEGNADVVSAELSYIAAPHLGFVLDVPYQIGIQQQPSGFQDISLLIQYLAAGSLEFDNMASFGLMATFPTARRHLGAGDYFVGPFGYAGQRWWHHLIFETNLTALLPVARGESARQLMAAGLLSILLTPVTFRFPVYAQAEVDATGYFGGTAALPPGKTHGPAETVFVAPEIFLGPFASPISAGTRVAGGVFFNLVGDRVHDRTYSVTLAFDVPNRYGY